MKGFKKEKEIRKEEEDGIHTRSSEFRYCHPKQNDTCPKLKRFQRPHPLKKREDEVEIPTLQSKNI